MAKKIGDVFVEVHFRSDGRELRDDIKKDPNYNKAGQDIGNEMGDGVNDSFAQKLREGLKEEDKVNKRRTAAFKGSMTKIENDLDKFWANEKKNMAEGIERPLGDITDDIERMGKKWRNIWERRVDIGIDMHDAKQVDDRLDILSDRLRNAAGWSAGLANEFEDMAKGVERSSNKVEQKGNVFTKLGRTFDRVGDSVGRAFGKGNRNNFVNFFGSAIGNIVKLVGLGPKLIGMIGNFGKAFNDARDDGQIFFKAVITGFAGMTEGAAGASAATGELAATGPAGLFAVAAAAGGIALALGPIAALISGIGGAIAAMAASVGFAVVGALAPLAGLIAPILIGIAAISAGLVGMDAKSKKAFQEGIKPLTDGFKELGKQARAGFFSTFSIDAKGVNDVLRDMDPLFRAVGSAIGNITNRFVNGFKSQSFNNFVQQMTVFVPNALESLGEIAQNVAGAIGNIFIDLIPSTNTFLGWLTGITQEFQNWTNTTAGRQQIVTFLDHAATSAQTVGDFLLSVTKLLGTIVGAGRTTGDSIFTDMTKQVQDFTKFLTPQKLAPKAPASEQLGGPKLESGLLPTIKTDPLGGFFKNAKDVADHLGTIAVNLGKIFDELDSPKSRKNLDHFMTFLELVSNPAVGTGLVGMVSPLGGIALALDHIGQSKAGKAIGDVIRGINNFGQKPLPQIDISKMISGGKAVLGKIIGPFKGVGKQALIAIGTFNIGNIVLGLGSVAKDIFNAFPSAHEILHSIGTFDIGDVMTGLGNVASSIFGAFPSAGEILSSIGHIDLSSLMHGSFTLPGGHKISWATGGIAVGPVTRLIGEAGPEAVVPLTGPLSRVDPAVRELSAFARGQITTASATGRGGRSVTTGPITIITPTRDPVAVAQQVINRVAAASYI